MLKAEKVIMSGRGPKTLWKITLNGVTQFQTTSTGYNAWKRKKDAKRIIDLIEEHGIDYVQDLINQNKI